MKRVKQYLLIISLIITMILTTGQLTVSVMADESEFTVPEFSVIIGNDLYELSWANMEENQVAIRKAVTNFTSGPIIIHTVKDNWINNETGKPLDANHGVSILSINGVKVEKKDIRFPVPTKPVVVEEPVVEKPAIEEPFKVPPVEMSTIIKTKMMPSLEKQIKVFSINYTSNRGVGTTPATRQAELVDIKKAVDEITLFYGVSINIKSYNLRGIDAVDFIVEYKEGPILNQFYDVFKQQIRENIVERKTGFLINYFGGDDDVTLNITSGLGGHSSADIAKVRSELLLEFKDSVVSITGMSFKGSNSIQFGVKYVLDPSNPVVRTPQYLVLKSQIDKAIREKKTKFTLEYSGNKILSENWDDVWEILSSAIADGRISSFRTTMYGYMYDLEVTYKK